MIVSYTASVDRQKEGVNWVAYFFKKRFNTIMIEDMWFSLSPDMSFSEVKDKLIEMSLGYDNIKKTASVSCEEESISVWRPEYSSLPSIYVKSVK